MYFHSCKYCGSNLDPGEVCDCRKETAPKPERPDILEAADHAALSPSKAGG